MEGYPSRELSSAHAIGVIFQLGPAARERPIVPMEKNRGDCTIQLFGIFLWCFISNNK